MFLKFGRDFGFRPRGGRVWEGIRGGFLFGFFGGHKKRKTHNIEISEKPRYKITIFLKELCLKYFSVEHNVE
jgi:hypothetical protein